MTGWLIVNEFIKGSNFDRIYQWLIEAGKKYKIDFQMKTNAEQLACIGFPNVKDTWRDNVDFIVFWDKDIRLAEYYESLSIPVFNSADSIRLCDDKSMTHLRLAKAGIKMPKTILAPMTFPNIGYTNYDFLQQVIEKLKFPMVVKECFGSFGQQVYLAHTEDELMEIVKRVPGVPILFQEFIKESVGRDVRLQVVGDRVIAGMMRYSETGDFRANLTNGGNMKAYIPTKEEEDLAVRCCKELGLVFAGVDLLFSDHGEKYVCEVNSNAHFRGIYECCGVNAADAILEEIVTHDECK